MHSPREAGVVLPFPRRKKQEEMELGDEDLVVLEEQAEEVDVRDLDVRSRLPRVTAPPKQSLRRLTTGQDDRLGDRSEDEDDVADECLKSIAAATSHARLTDSFPASIVPPPPRLPSFEYSDLEETAQRPAFSSSAVVPIARESVPGVLPVTVFSPASSVPPFRESAPAPRDAPAPAVFARAMPSASPASPAISSMAPVSLSSAPGATATGEPTVILVPQPPRTGWIIGAAFLGAACAVLGMRVLSHPADRAPATIVVAAPPPPPAATAPTPAPGPAPPPATIRFNEDQAVAVVAPAAPPKPVATVIAVKPVAAPPVVRSTKPSAVGGRLPDGSTALGARPQEPTRGPAGSGGPQAPAQPEAASSTPRRKLTPEQELAEAQLKASMR
jgi:hypothetical protein